MDTIIFRVEHVCGYSLVSTEVTIKVSKQNLYAHTSTYGDIKTILQENGLGKWLSPVRWDVGNLVSYEVYNGYRMNKEKYFDIKTGLRSFFQFLTDNTVIYVAFQVFYLNFITHKYKEALNHFQINRYNKLSPNHYIDDRGNYFILSENFGYLNYLYSSHLIIELLHQTVKDNVNAFVAGDTVYEKIITVHKLDELKYDYDLANEIINDRKLNTFIDKNTKVLKFKKRIFIETDKKNLLADLG